MSRALLVPPDAMLYEQAKNYVAVIVAMRQGCSEPLLPSLEATRQQCHQVFEASLVRHGIEFDNKQDVLDIAVELERYAERSTF